MYPESDLFILDQDMEGLSRLGVSYLATAPAGTRELIDQLTWQPATTDAAIAYDGDVLVTAPRLEAEALFFVGGVLDHRQHRVLGRVVQGVIEYALRATGSPSYVTSAKPGSTGCLVCDRFRYDVFRHISSGNLTTPMAVASEGAGWVLVWDADLEYTFICRSAGSQELNQLFSDRKAINQTFRGEYLSAMPSGQRHRYLLERYVGVSFDQD